MPAFEVTGVMPSVGNCKEMERIGDIKVYCKDCGKDLEVQDVMYLDASLECDGSSIEIDIVSGPHICGYLPGR